MAKAIATHYLIGLILIVIALVVIVYIFISRTNIFTNTASRGDCEAKRLRYCFEWSKTNYMGFPSLGTWDNFAPRCSDIGVSVKTQSDCQGI